METTKMTFRFASPKDIEQIIDLSALHANYEKAEYSRNGKAVKLSRDLFSEPYKLFCLVISDESKKLLGYATYMKQYSTWDAEEYIYMDCLFIKEAYRGNKLGEKMIQRIQLESKKLGCSIIQWQTPDFNSRAINFYYRIGANAKTKERFFLNTLLQTHKK